LVAGDYCWRRRVAGDYWLQAIIVDAGMLQAIIVVGAGMLQAIIVVGAGMVQATTCSREASDASAARVSRPASANSGRGGVGERVHLLPLAPSNALSVEGLGVRHLVPLRPCNACMNSAALPKHVACPRPRAIHEPTHTHTHTSSSVEQTYQALELV